jgi:kinesin family protein 2/24
MAQGNEHPAMDDWAALPYEVAAKHAYSVAQEAKWADANVDGRAHWSVREQYKLHAARFKVAVGDFRLAWDTVEAQRAARFPLPLPAIGRLFDFHGLYQPAVPFANGVLTKVPKASDAVAENSKLPRLAVIVRKRPLLPFEIERDEWDCVDMHQGTKIPYVICHEGRLERTGRRLVMSHRAFAVDGYLNAASGDRQLRAAVQPLLADARAGRNATLLLLGQTGTGKTHTLLGVLRLLGEEKSSGAMDVQFYEVHGKKCFDLLNARKQVHLRADENDQVHVRGAETASFEPGNVGDLEACLAEALALRSAEATERNPMSSRSHAVLTVSVGTGMLRIVDLAGSERNYETTKMSAAAHKAFAENAASLMALRACFRSLHQDGRKPYRESKLTHLLKESFSPGHRTTVLATVSPSATDAIHTQHTLEVATALQKRLEDARGELILELPVAFPPAHAPVETWTAEELAAWLGTAQNGRFSKLTMPPGMDGQGILELRDIGAAFARKMREARDEEGVEGVSWNIPAAIKTDLLQQVFAALTEENETRRRKPWLTGGPLEG